jgi:ubiquinone/menaquinone biosynthesis C-methylase UbiE
MEWVYQHINFPRVSRILELGCGPGYLWRKNSQHVNPGCRIYLTDLSPGMLTETRRTFSKVTHYSFLSVDAQRIPFPGDQFDAVVANLMYNHIPDIPFALAEIRRVRKSGCCLYATFNGKNHLQEIHMWEEDYFKEPDTWGNSADRFGLEN